jgi:8-oxo-dGTP pyrophosphatase MutT (NUDIX family)
LILLENIKELYEKIGYRGAGIALFRETPQGFKIFLGKRKFNPGKNSWTFPGGGVEGKDSFWKTAVREFWEETGIGFGMLNAKTIDEVVISAPFFEWHTFMCLIPGTILRTKLIEFSKMAWVPETKINQYRLHPGVKTVIDRYRKLRR